MDQIKLSEYEAFVKSTVSQPSSDIGVLLGRLAELSDNKLNVNIPMLMTGYTGLSSEAGEFSEIVKKIIFQGKELSADTVFHMKRELGDAAWYFAICCLALDVDINTIIRLNIEKLSPRYPNGFEILRSEVREAGDI